MPDKLCQGCGHTLPLSEFYAHPFGKMQRQNRCKVCQSRYSKGHYARRKAQMVAETVR
jgi:hypothetical protein